MITVKPLKEYNVLCLDLRTGEEFITVDYTDAICKFSLDVFSKDKFKVIKAVTSKEIIEFNKKKRLKNRIEKIKQNLYV